MQIGEKKNIPYICQYTYQENKACITQAHTTDSVYVHMYVCEYSSVHMMVYKQIFMLVDFA